MQGLQAPETNFRIAAGAEAVETQAPAVRRSRRLLAVRTSPFLHHSDLLAEGEEQGQGQ